MMQQDRFDVLLETQRDYFRTGATLPVSFRVEMLKKLRAAVAAHEEEIVRALKEDLGKGAYESYMCEVGMVLSELSWLIRRTPRLAGKTRVKTPLAFYFFSEDKARIEGATSRCAFGGGCVNDVIIHLATSEMGFGGVGESGMGAYHGKEGFEAFSHRKSIVDKKTWMDLPMRYQPYRGLYEKALRLFLR